MLAQADDDEAKSAGKSPCGAVRVRLPSAIYVSKRARDDLDEIRRYIAEELSNPTAAVSAVKKITAAIRILRDYALAGAALASVTGVESDYRFLGAGSYIIFYRVHGRDVFVDRVLYGRRDYLSVLFGDLDDRG